mgnify:CR=1 FL=1
MDVNYNQSDTSEILTVDVITLGDVDQNGMINVADLVTVVSYILNGNYNIISDIDENGFVNVVDVVMIVHIILN